MIIRTRIVKTFDGFLYRWECTCKQRGQPTTQTIAQLERLDHLETHGIRFVDFADKSNAPRGTGDVNG
jgi:hypothetical protein